MNQAELQKAYAKAGGFISPSPGDVHINAPLSNISISYLQSDMAFVASRVFPIVPVSKQSDKYFVFDKGDLHRDAMERRAPGTETAGGGYSLSDEQYFCDVWGLHKDVDDQVRANSDSPLGPDRNATQYLTQKAMIRMEREWAGVAMVSSAWDLTMDGQSTAAEPTDLTANGTNNTHHWNEEMSHPIQDVRFAKQQVLLHSGMMPNVLTVSRQVFDTLMDHPDIIDRLNAGQTPGGPAMANKDRLAQLFEVDEVLCMDGIYNSAKIGADASNSFIGGKHALLSVRPGSPALETQSAGYFFAWRGLVGGSGGAGGMRIKRYRMEQLAADRLEIESAFDFKITSKSSAVFFNGIIA